ncbi:MAG: arginyltransferase [Pseudomonadota bacterium]
MKNTLALYASAPHPCNYLPGEEAITVFADPRTPASRRLYSQLVDHGFRRSGEHIYRPGCRDCTACVAVRVPVAQFQPNRTQRRIWRRNQDLEIIRVPVARNSEHFALYQRYLTARHPGGGMDNPDPANYMSFFASGEIDTTLIEFRHEEELLAVAVTDYLPQGLSAVYTFFDPTLEHRARSLGVYAILWQIEEAKRLGLPFVYLGYWIEKSPKMSYKSRYRPLEGYRDRKWGVL